MAAGLRQQQAARWPAAAQEPVRGPPLRKRAKPALQLAHLAPRRKRAHPAQAMLPPVLTMLEALLQTPFPMPEQVALVTCSYPLSTRHFR